MSFSHAAEARTSNLEFLRRHCEKRVVSLRPGSEWTKLHKKIRGNSGTGAVWSE